jgi:NAD(P)-dependent dehydrogenase (short-subunit alcohol dehydrogenase family)
VATQTDVRDYGAVKTALDESVTQLGRLDIVSANAGIFSFATLEAITNMGHYTARPPRLDTSGEQDEELARDLARLGRGRLRRIRAYTDVAPALSDLFAD